MSGEALEDWERLLAAERHLQALVPGSVLLERLGEDEARTALQKLDELYPQPSGASVLAEVIERLGSAQPVDVAEIDLATYRGLKAEWNDWNHVTARGRHWARVLTDPLLRGDAP